tara:strand:- start:118 stop:249 length:132 start_codon:yes stop_codon:yes gene_type:complete
MAIVEDMQYCHILFLDLVERLLALLSTFLGIEELEFLLLTFMR